VKTRFFAVLAFLVGVILLALLMPGRVKLAVAPSRRLSLAAPNPALGRPTVGLELTGEDGQPVARSSAEVETSSSCAYPLPDGMCVYYGDLHSQTSYSDGQGTPQQHYQVARANGLDVYSVNDHAFLTDDDEWNDIIVQARAATVDGQFVGLHSFEWTGGCCEPTSYDGHINVFGTSSIVRADNPDYDSLDELYAWLADPAQINVVAQFNHPFFPSKAFDRLRYDSLADPHISMIEIRNGDSHCVNKYRAALVNGWHVAPTNNSDTHKVNGGERRARNGIVASGLTYHHVIDALRVRRVFSTDDENLALAMRADGYWMGSVIPHSLTHFDIYAYDPDPGDAITTLDLYWNNGLFTSTVVNTNAFTWSLPLPAPPSPGSWWYVRATQSDGDRAYTSPIWIHQPEQYDVLVRDNMWDSGNVPSADPVWQSPDVWVRRQADGQMWHENPVAGETNHVHARVQNAGSSPLTDVDVYFYWANPSLGFVWPDSWNPINPTPLRVQNLAPGAATTVSFPWDVPASAPEQTCLLVRLVSTHDPIRYEGSPKWDNNIGWRNVHVVGTTADVTFYLINPFAEDRAADLHIFSSDFPAQGSLVLHLTAELFDSWLAGTGYLKGAVADIGSRTITVTHPVDAVVYGLPLQAGEISTATLALNAPLTSTLAVRVSEQIEGEEIGGNLYTTLSSDTPRKVTLETAADSVVISRSVEITAVVAGEGFVPVADGTEIQFGTTLGSLSANTAQTQNGLVTVTLDAGATPGTAVVHAHVSGLITATAVVNVYRVCWARLNDDATDYATVQAAVDDSTSPSDVVKVAGRCTTPNTHGGLAQVVYISKTVTVRGGYTTTNWTTSDPAANPTTLDAQGRGRVVYITGGPSPTIEGLRITGGDAGGLSGGPSGEDAGGGVYVSNATVTMRGNQVSGNTAGSGGGLYLSSGDVTLVNNLVADNQASDLGSGLYIRGSSARLLHTTIARNGSSGFTGGDGSALYVTNNGSTYSTVALTNTILVSHTVGITATGGNTVRLEATLWGSDTWANVTDWGGAGTITTGAIDIWGDPAFVDPDAGDYHIGGGSAALNAGVDAGVRDDLDGDPRPLGHGYDIGADEIRIGLAVSKHADSDPAQAGAQLGYTIHVTNTGDVDLHATITDVLPAHVESGEATGGTITWTPVITAPGGVWTQQVTVTVASGYVGSLTNVVQVTTGEGATGVYSETVAVECLVYLPFVTRKSYPPGFCAPQLIAEVGTGPEPRGVALDTAGRRAFVAHADGISVIDADTLAVITETQLLTATHGIAYDPDHDRIWLTGRDVDRVIVLDGATYDVLANVPAGDGPRGVAYNPANGRVYVTNFWDHTVSVYDAETMAHVEELTGFAEPAHLAVNSVTNKIYVANHRPNGGVIVIDGSSHSRQQIGIALIDAYGVAVDTTRNLVYVTAIAQGRISIIDGATGQQVGSQDIKRDGGETVPLRVVAVNPDAGPGGHLWLVTSSDDGGQDQLLLIPNGWPALGTPVPLDVASYPREGIALDPARGRVWVTSVDSGLVSVVQDGEPVCDIPFSASGGD